MEENTYRVLIVDDEPEIRRFLRASLRAHRHEILEADTGAKALSAVKEFHPDLIVLDLGLPDVDGMEVTRRIREWSQVPIIVLSVRNREEDKIEALDAGADDYLTKPFGVGELMARMRGVMRRSLNVGSGPAYQVGNLCVDIAHHQASLKGVEIALTPIEFEILNVLVQNAGKVVTHRQLIHKVWGAGYAEDSRLLRVNISNLRQKIEPNPSQPIYILTELGVGYRLKNPDD